MDTYGTPTHCRGCDHDADCLPWLVTWVHEEWLGTGDHRDPTERVFYCVDCAQIVLALNSIQGIELGEFRPDWTTLKQLLPEVAPNIEVVKRRWHAPAN